MAIEEKFEIIRDENEHENNELHKLCKLYRHWIYNGVNPKEARRYIKWYYKNGTYREQDE